MSDLTKAATISVHTWGRDKYLVLFNVNHVIISVVRMNSAAILANDSVCGAYKMLSAARTAYDLCIYGPIINNTWEMCDESVTNM